MRFLCSKQFLSIICLSIYFCSVCSNANTNESDIIIPDENNLKIIPPKDVDEPSIPEPNIGPFVFKTPLTFDIPDDDDLIIELTTHAPILENNTSNHTENYAIPQTKSQAINVSEENELISEPQIPDEYTYKYLFNMTTEYEPEIPDEIRPKKLETPAPEPTFITTYITRTPTVTDISVVSASIYGKSETSESLSDRTHIPSTNNLTESTNLESNFTTLYNLTTEPNNSPISTESTKSSNTSYSSELTTESKTVSKNNTPFETTNFTELAEKTSTDATKTSLITMNSTTDIKAQTPKLTTITTISTTVINNAYYEQCFRESCAFGSLCESTGRDVTCVCDAPNGFTKLETSSSCTQICDASRKACGSAKCVVRANQVNSFECVCDAGYLFETDSNGNPYCKPNQCNYPYLTQCDHYCENIYSSSAFHSEYLCKCYSGYDIQSDRKTCKPVNATLANKCADGCGRGVCSNGDCVCRTGFMFVSGNCQIDTNWCSQRCPDGCLEMGGQVVCNCSAPEWRASPITGMCERVHRCDANEDGKTNCDAMGALCFEQNYGYRCVCPERTRQRGEKCVDLCELEENLLTCDGLNAVCVHDTASVTQFRCDCKPGFYRVDATRDQTCVMAMFTLVVRLKLRNPSLLGERQTFYESEEPTSRLNGQQIQNVITGDIAKQLWRSLVERVPQIKSVSLMNCPPIDEHYAEFECDVSVQMNEDFDDGSKQLIDVLNNCETKSKDNQLCYLPPKTVYGSTQIQYYSFDPCNSVDVCSMSAYTKCHQIVGTTQAECLCPRDGYRVADTRFIGETLNGKLLRIEYCEDVDECLTECKADHQTCINTIGSYTCRCDSGYKMNGSRGLACVPDCDDAHCGHGQCRAADNGFWCLCDDGYTGDNCQTKGSVQIETIYVVIVSALALLLLVMSLLAGFCLGKAKALNEVNGDIPVAETREQFRRTPSLPPLPPLPPRVTVKQTRENSDKHE